LSETRFPSPPGPGGPGGPGASDGEKGGLNRYIIVIIVDHSYWSVIVNILVYDDDDDDDDGDGDGDDDDDDDDHGYLFVLY